MRYYIYEIIAFTFTYISICMWVYVCMGISVCMYVCYNLLFVTLNEPLNSEINAQH